MSRRSFRDFIRQGRSTFLVSELGDRVTGYSLVLYRRGTSLARLYSIAVLPEVRGTGCARGLLEATEAEARSNGCLFLRLEVRPDNDHAIALYEKRGYRRFGRYLDYYADHADALRYEKRLEVKTPA